MASHASRVLDGEIEEEDQLNSPGDSLQQYKPWPVPMAVAGGGDDDPAIKLRPQRFGGPARGFVGLHRPAGAPAQGAMGVVVAASRRRRLLRSIGSEFGIW